VRPTSRCRAAGRGDVLGNGAVISASYQKTADAGNQGTVTGAMAAAGQPCRGSRAVGSDGRGEGGVSGCHRQWGMITLSAPYGDVIDRQWFSASGVTTRPISKQLAWTRVADQGEGRWDSAPADQSHNPARKRQ
jgi:hypothetical protein